MWRAKDIKILLELVDGCIKNLPLLDSAIALDVKKDACESFPLLEGVVSQLEEKGVPGNEWVDVCKKSFFTQLRDSYMENYPTLSFSSLKSTNRLLMSLKN